MFKRHLGTQFDPSSFHSISNDALPQRNFNRSGASRKEFEEFFDRFSKALGNYFTTEPLDDHLIALIAGDEVGSPPIRPPTSHVDIFG